jgi:diadenylate cyclase
MPANLFDIPQFLRQIQGIPWWQIAIELIMIGLVVFWVVAFLRGTRGARMLRGIAFILVALFLIVHLLGTVFQLKRVEFLYSKLLVGVSFVVAVVFQPELRRALMRLGEAKRKIGALIAIERETGLGGIAESGTRVNADISADLLNTIFWPNSPLHDLGVVISNGRVAYAGVQFPLAESGELERELGSRHRAAVGMSQETDAVVLIVSEETGDISIAERGQLIRKLTAESLRGLLGELLNRGQSETFRGGPMPEPGLS